MRSVLFLGEDPDTTQRRIVAHAKSNNAPLGQSVAYLIQPVDCDLVTPAGALVTVAAPRVAWDGLSTLTATDLVTQVLTAAEEQPALEQAQEFLAELLQDGPVLVDDIRKAVKQVGVTWITVRRAKDALGIMARRREIAGTPSKTWPWEWRFDSRTEHRDEVPL
jgi:hypothetical protein